MRVAQGSILLIFLLGKNLYGSETLSRDASEESSLTQCLYIVSRDKTIVSLDPSWKNISPWIKRHCARNASAGSQERPLKIKLSHNALATFIANLPLLSASHEDDLRTKLQETIPLKEMVDLYVALYELELYSSKEIVESFLIDRLQNDATLSLLIDSPEFRESLDACQKANPSLALLLLSKDEQKFLRSQLYNDLRTSCHTDFFQLNKASTLLLVGGTDIEGGAGTLELWNPWAKHPDLRLETPEPTQNAIFQAGPEIIVQSALSLSLWNMLTRSSIYLAQLDAAKAKKKNLWGLCTTDDLTLIGLGMHDTIYVLRVDKKSIDEMTFPEQEGCSFTKIPYAELLFSGGPKPLLIALGIQGQVDFYDPVLKVCIAQECVHGEKISRFFVQGKTLVTMTNAGEYCVWDCERTHEKRLLARGRFPSTNCTLALKGQRFAMTEEDQSVAIFFFFFNPQEGSEHVSEPLYRISKKDRQLLVDEDGNRQSTVLPSKYAPSSVCISLDGSLIIGAQGLTTIRIWHFLNPHIKEFLSSQMTLAQVLTLKVLMKYLIARFSERRSSSAQGFRASMAALHLPHIQAILSSLPPEVLAVLQTCLPEILLVQSSDIYQQRGTQFWKSAVASTLVSRQDSTQSDERFPRSSSEKVRKSSHIPKRINDPELMRSVSLRGLSDVKKKAAGLSTDLLHSFEDDEEPSDTPRHRRSRRNTMTDEALVGDQVDAMGSKAKKRPGISHTTSARALTERGTRKDRGLIDKEEGASPDQSPSSHSSSDRALKTDRSHRRKNSGLTQSADVKNLTAITKHEEIEIPQSPSSLEIALPAAEVAVPLLSPQPIAEPAILVSSERLPRLNSGNRSKEGSPSLSKKRTLKKTAVEEVPNDAEVDNSTYVDAATVTREAYQKAFERQARKAAQSSKITRSTTGGVIRIEAPLKKTQSLTSNPDAIVTTAVSTITEIDQQSEDSAESHTPRAVVLPNLLTIAEQQVRAKSAFSMRNYTEAHALFSEINKYPDSLEEKKRSHWWLGELYFHGWGVPFNFKNAFDHYELVRKYRMDEEQFISATYRLGLIYFYGYGCQSDVGQADGFFQEACTLSEKLLQEKVKQQYGKTPLEQLEQKKNLTLIKAVSKFHIGLCREKESLDGNATKGRWTNLMANSEGHQAAGYNVLQSLYAEFKALKKDDATIALQLARLSQMNKRLPTKHTENYLLDALKTRDEYLMAETFELLGVHYSGKEETRKKAIQNLRKASRQEINPGARARAAMSLCRLFLGAQGAPIDAKEASTYLLQVAQQTYEMGLSYEAAYEYAQLHELDDPSKALEYYTKVAEQKEYLLWHLKALLKLGEISFKLRDFDGARTNFEMVEQETQSYPLEIPYLAKAWLNLGNIYGEGLGNCEEDRVKALAYYNLVSTHASGELKEVAEEKIRVLESKATNSDK